MDEVFRPTKDARLISSVSLTLSIFPLLLVYFLFREDPQSVLSLQGAFLIFFPVFTFVLEIMIRKSFIRINDKFLSGRVLFLEIKIGWDEVLAVRAIHNEYYPQKFTFLIIKTSNKNHKISLKIFDGKSIWKIILAKSRELGLDIGVIWIDKPVEED